MGMLTSLFILSFLIFFHELGHFLAARFFGVRVDVFSIGFGNKIFSFKKGDTEYRLSMIPLGGYVKMKGQDDLDPAKQNQDFDSYNTKHPLQRIVILFAGPFANFLLAFFAYLLIAMSGFSVAAPVVKQATPDFPAYKAGIRDGDEIVRINNKDIKTWYELTKAIQSSEGTVEVTVKRNNVYQSFLMNTVNNETENIYKEKVQRKIIGISVDTTKTIEIEMGAFEAIAYGFNKTVQASFFILEGLKKLIVGVIPAKELGGVVSIVQVTAKASQDGFIAVLSLAALISVNLGILNLLPIPALDGGHIMFNTYELITKRAPSEKMLIRLTVFGWAFLLTLMLFGIYNDINRILE